MSKFYSRARMMGTTVPFDILSQPFIRSQKRADPSNNEFADLTPLLPVSITFRFGPSDTAYVINLLATDTTLDDIVDRINATVLAADGSAYHQDGFLYVQATQLGEGSYVEVTAGGAAADAMGFPILPDPYARVEGGDIPFSPPDNYEGDHPFGPLFIQRKEDVTPQVVNRGLYQLASNDDVMDYYLRRPMALPMIIDVDVSDPLWAARLVDDGTNYVQLDLRNIQSDFPQLSDRIYVAPALSNVSTLRQISRYFAVQAPDDVEMVVDGKSVRVGAVTHGQRVVPITFPTLPSGAYDEDAPPSASVPNTANWQAGGGLGDGGNILGGNWQKSAPAVIDEILYRSGVTVGGATYLADNVRNGDWAVISGALVDVPFNHDGTYLVDQVISGERFLLRPADPANAELNPDDSAAFGNMEVRIGEFAEGVWLSFVPGIPIGTDFKLIVGMQASLAEMDFDYLLRLLVRTSEDVDDLVQQVIRIMKGPLLDDTDDFTKFPFANGSYGGALGVTMEALWTKSTLGGAYQGMGWSEGSGHRAEITHKPAKWINSTARQAAPGASVLGPIPCDILPGNVLYVAGGSFEVAHVGNTVRITAGLPNIDEESAFQIVEYIDQESVRLEPGKYEPDIFPSPGVLFEMFNNTQEYLPFTNMALGLGRNQDQGLGGYLYVGEMDELPTDPDFMTESFLALRQSTIEAETLWYLRDVAVDIVAGEVIFPIDVTASWNIRYQSREQFGGVIHITNSPQNDGWYRIRLPNPPFGMFLSDMDGGVASLSDDISGNARATIYYTTFGSGASQGVQRDPLGTVVYEDFLETSPFGQGMGVLNVTWRGDALRGGIYGKLNDNSFTALDPATAEVGATGAAISFYTFFPAYGLDMYHEGAAVGAVVPETAAWRGGWAARLRAKTYSMDPSAAGALSMGGTTALLTQMGYDSVLQLAANESPAASGLIWDNYTDLLTPAMVPFASERDRSMLQSGAFEGWGAFYQKEQRRWNASDWLDQGGIYSELSGAFQNALYPMSYSGNQWSSPGADDFRYYEVREGFDGLGGWFRTKARLGWPAAIQVGLTPLNHFAPDPAESRSHETSGFVEWDDTEFVLEWPFDRYIGCQLTLPGSGVPAADNMFTIINVIPLDTVGLDRFKSAKVEVLGKHVLVNNATPPGSVSLLGARWHYGYVDVANYYFLGTEWQRDGAYLDPEAYPMEGVWDPALWTRDTGGVAYAWPNQGREVHGFENEGVSDDTYGISFYNHDYGHGMRGAGYGAFDVDKVGFLDPGWCSAYLRLKPQGAPVGWEPFIDVLTLKPSDYWTSEWLWLSNTAFNADIYVSTLQGMIPGRAAMHCSVSPSGGASDGTIYLKLRESGSFSIRSKHGSFRVKARGRFENTNVEDLWIFPQLVQDDGTALVAGTGQVVNPNNDWTLDQTLDIGNLLEGGEAGYSNTEVHLELIFQFDDVDIGTGDRDLDIYEVNLSTEAPAVTTAGNRIIEGAVIAQDFRYLTQRKTWISVSPAEASLYVPHGYAWENPVQTPQSLYAGNELPVDPMGRALVCTAINPPPADPTLWYVEAGDCVDFRKGLDYAAIRFLTKLTDPASSWDGANYNQETPVEGVWHPTSRVGFVVPVRAPHDSYLTELDLQMSFTPCRDVLTGPGADSFFNIWYSRKPLAHDNLGVPGSGVDRYGCRVRLVRIHLLPNTDQELTDYLRRAKHEEYFNGVIGYGNSQVVGRDRAWFQIAPVDTRSFDVDRAYGEVIFQSYLELPVAASVPDPAPNQDADNEGMVIPEMSGGVLTGVTRNIHSEFFAWRKYPLISEIEGNPGSRQSERASDLWGVLRRTNPEAYLVDNRHFAYVLIIDAWGQGLLSSTWDGSDGNYTGTPAANSGAAANQFEESGVPPWARIYSAPTDPFGTWDLDDDRPHAPIIETPVMKFRGLRVGVEKSRP